MPARVVVVMRDHNFANATAHVLAAHGIEAVSFSRPMEALCQLDHAVHTEILVTSGRFQGTQPTGLSIARVTRMRRPNLKVIFVDRPEVAPYVADDASAFMEMPVSADEVVQMVERLVHESNDALH